MVRIEHEVLVRPAMNPYEDPVAPTDALAGNSTLSGSSFVAHSLSEEWQPRAVLSASDLVVDCAAISANITSESHKGRMLN